MHAEKSQMSIYMWTRHITLQPPIVSVTNSSAVSCPMMTLFPPISLAKFSTIRQSICVGRIILLGRLVVAMSISGNGVLYVMVGAYDSCRSSNNVAYT